MSTARIRLITLAVVASLGAGTALAADAGTRNSVTPPAPTAPAPTAPAPTAPAPTSPDSATKIVPIVGGVGKKVAVTRAQTVKVRQGKVVLVNRITGKVLVVRPGSVLIVRGVSFRVVGTKLVRIKATR